MQKIIEARIIELQNKKIKIDADITHYTSRIEMGIDKKNIDLTRSKIRRLKSKMYELEKVLLLNQSLLTNSNEHYYQLEN